MLNWLKPVIFAAPLLLLAACTTTGPTDSTTATGDSQQSQTDQSQTSGDQAATGATAQGMQADVGMAMNQLDDPNSPLATRTIYFAFDSAQVDTQSRDVVSAHAKYLAANPSQKVVLEGHADERGSREYNIGLGERRSNAVSQLISFEGVSAGQLEGVSYGEEKPVAMGHDDASWRLNRRVEIIYQGQ